MAEDSKPEITSFEESLAKLEMNHAAAIGRIALSWNSLHEVLGNCFAMLIFPGAEEYGWAAWHSQMDRAQRSMLVAVIEAKRERAPKGTEAPVMAEIVWLINRLKPNERNMSIHTPFAVMIDNGLITMTTAHWGGHPYAMKLKGKDIAGELEAFRKTIADALDFARRLKNLLADNAPAPLPPRPLSLMTDKERAELQAHQSIAGKANPPPLQS